MPCHLICDAHEWTNVIITVSKYNSVKPLQRERALFEQRGKKTLLILTDVFFLSLIYVCRIIGRYSNLKYQRLYFVFYFSFFLICISVRLTGAVYSQKIIVCVLRFCQDDFNSFFVYNSTKFDF